MPPTMFGTGANSAIAGGIRIIIRYGISWICSARATVMEKRQTPLASSKSLKTGTLIKLQLAETKRYTTDR